MCEAFILNTEKGMLSFLAVLQMFRAILYCLHSLNQLFTAGSKHVNQTKAFNVDGVIPLLYN